MVATEQFGPTAEVSFDAFYAAHYRRAVRYATRFVGQSGSEDVAQRVMLRMLSYYDRLDPTRPAWNYVLVATRNECFSERRQIATTLGNCAAVEACLTTGIDTAREVLARDDWRRVAHAIMGLPPVDRQILINHVWYGVSLAQLARRHGITETTMRQRVHRLRRRLRRTLDGEAPA